MPENPRIYSSKNAPSTPRQGDIQFNESNNTIEAFTGTAWGGVSFATVAATTVTATSGIRLTTGFASTNATSPGFYIPTVAGAPVGAIPSLAGQAAVVWDTVTRAIHVQQGGSWFTTASLALG